MSVVMHMNQLHRLKDTNTTISRIAIQGAHKLVDHMPNDGYKGDFTFADLPACLSRIHRKNRVDSFTPRLWGRVQGHPAKFHEVNGIKIFPKISSTTGNMLAAQEFRLKQKFDWVNEDPGAAFFISSCQVDSAY